MMTRFLAVLLAFLCVTTEAAAQPPRDAVEPEVVIVPIYGAIDTSTVALVRRAIREASSSGVAWLMLDIDTPGGAVQSLRDIEATLAAMNSSGGPQTVAWVRSQALSAGGYLAMASKRMFMAPPAVMGAITPVEVGPTGIQQIANDDARAKLLSVFRADLRRLAQERGMTGDSLTIAEAMVDPRMRIYEIVYEDESGADVSAVVTSEDIGELEARGTKIRRQQQVGLKTPLTLTSEEALRFGFSSGTFDTIEEALRQGLGVSPDASIEIVPSWSETAADWLGSMRLFLFVLGFMLLLVEVKTPGFAIPGVLGVLLLGLGLFGSYLVGLAEWTEILLFFLGILLIGIEIFVLPGTVIAGVVGFVCLVAALILSQQTFLFPANQTQSEILTENLVSLLQLLVLVIIGTALVWRFLPNIPVVNRLLLSPPEGARTGDANSFGNAATSAEREGLVGKVGVAETDLRPAGILGLGTERLDVVAEGGFIERGSSVRILEVSGNRIVVVRDGASESGEVAVGWLVLLLVVGFALIVAEVFFVSFGILAIGAAVSLVSAVFLAFTHSQALGFVFLVFCALGAPICVFFTLRYLPRTGLGRKLLLAGPEHADVTSAAEQPGIAEFRGRSGTAVSDLRPAGYARIDGRRVDVVTRGEMITADTPIIVVDVEGNRVVVTTDTNQSNPSEE